MKNRFIFCSFLAALCLIIMSGTAACCDACLLDTNEHMFVYSDLEVNPLKVNTGEVVTVNVDIENMAGARESTEVQLLIDGVVEDTKELLLDPGEQRTISFTFSKDKPGKYMVIVGYSMAEVEVEERTIPAPAVIIILISLFAIYLLVNRNR